MAERIVGDRYELVRPLGWGGMGEVWLGRDNRLDRDVAVKLLRPGGLPAGVDVESLVARFAREARLTAKLENSGVPAVYDTGTDNDDLYLVMQLIGGADLAEFEAENEPVPVGWVAAIGAQVASVLGAAHAVGLVHRDLKPRNVMITNSGEVKVLDFGIAVLRDADLTRITRTAEAVGTPAYMAPEQAMHGASSPSSDLYSLGCVLYELLTGQIVFEASTALAIMHRHYSDVPSPVLDLRPDVDPRLADLVTRLLAKDPRQRPADAREVYDILVRLIPEPSNGSLIPMDPTRPFRDLLSMPEPPAPLPAWASAEIPAFFPPPRADPEPEIPNPPASRYDTPVRRMVESALIAIGFMSIGFDLGDWDNPAAGSLTDRLFNVGLGLGLVLIGALMRKRRLALRYLWSVSWYRPTRPASIGERITEKVLLIFGILVLAVYAPPTVLSVSGISPWSLEGTTPATGLSLCFAVLIPGLIMRQRRLGRRYPWYV
jgi:serine/threonine protein kinase